MQAVVASKGRGVGTRTTGINGAVIQNADETIDQITAAQNGRRRRIALIWLGKCSTKHAPWFIIPSNHKWFRNLAISRIVSETLGQRARLQRKLRSAFNPHWESLFREGRAASRLGRQIMEFACIYTSRVSNFLNYPTDKFFARPVEVLPHERWALPET